MDEADRRQRMFSRLTVMGCTGVRLLLVDGVSLSVTAMGKWSKHQRTHLLDALDAELLACLAGVRAAGVLGRSKVVIETDSMLARMALETNSFALAPTGGVYE